MEAIGRGFDSPLKRNCFVSTEKFSASPEESPDNDDYPDKSWPTLNGVKIMPLAETEVPCLKEEIERCVNKLSEIGCKHASCDRLNEDTFRCGGFTCDDDRDIVVRMSVVEPEN